jgi:hypothetical protein
MGLRDCLFDLLTKFSTFASSQQHGVDLVAFGARRHPHVAQASLPAGDLGIPAQVGRSQHYKSWEQGCSPNPPVLRSSQIESPVQPATEGGQAGKPALRRRRNCLVPRSAFRTPRSVGVECWMFTPAFLPFRVFCLFRGLLLGPALRFRRPCSKMPNTVNPFFIFFVSCSGRVVT